MIRSCILAALIVCSHTAFSQTDADGRLWVMTGPLGGNLRQTLPYETADGGSGMLRFTRFNVLPDQFESTMECTQDGGETWVQGNHQTFQRVAPLVH